MSIAQLLLPQPVKSDLCLLVVFQAGKGVEKQQWLVRASPGGRVVLRALSGTLDMDVEPIKGMAGPRAGSVGVPTKRRRIPPRQAGLSERALEAWRAGDFHTLNCEVGIRPWQISPFDALTHRPDPQHPHPAYDTTWPNAMAVLAACRRG